MGRRSRQVPRWVGHDQASGALQTGWKRKYSFQKRLQKRFFIDNPASAMVKHSAYRTGAIRFKSCRHKTRSRNKRLSCTASPLAPFVSDSAPRAFLQRIDSATRNDPNTRTHRQQLFPPTGPRSLHTCGRSQERPARTSIQSATRSPQSTMKGALREGTSERAS